MSEMIERVARALWSQHASRVQAVAESGRTIVLAGWEWETQEATMQAYFLDFARAAIAAVREPTEAMVTAGLDDYEFGGRTREHVAADWRAMIDAALK